MLVRKKLLSLLAKSKRVLALSSVGQDLISVKAVIARTCYKQRRPPAVKPWASKCEMVDCGYMPLQCPADLPVPAAQPVRDHIILRAAWVLNRSRQ